MIVIASLTCFKLISLMSTPSNEIFPLSFSTILVKALHKVLLPAPVLPTIPIFSPALILKVHFLRTRSVSSLYLRCKFLTLISPFFGHCSSGCLGWSSFSWGTSSSFKHLLIEIILDSRFPTLWIIPVMWSPSIMIHSKATDRTTALVAFLLWTNMITVMTMITEEEIFIYAEYHTHVANETCWPNRLALLFSWSVSTEKSDDPKALIVELPLIVSE